MTSQGFVGTVDNMEYSPENHRTLLVLSIWTEMTPNKQLAWRGSIRTIDGPRRSFRKLDDLSRLLCELSGWRDEQMEQMEQMEVIEDTGSE